MSLLDIFIFWKPIVEILLLWFVVYQVMIFFEGTRAFQVLRGIVILLIAFFIIQRFDFEILDWLFTKFFGISVIALLIIFQPEIRQGLARLGQRHMFSTSLREEELDYVLNHIVRAVENLCKEKSGALIAIEKKDPLNAYIEGGEIVDAKVSADLIETIFTPKSLLHDGGIVIQHGRIVAAGCLFPLTESHELSRVFGTRHRAALGLSEETDAIIIVASEERQDISIVYRGKLSKGLNREEVIAKTKELMRAEN
jgi:diadenylate cyclase